MQNLNILIKKALNPQLKTLIKAGFLNSDLSITNEGKNMNEQVSFQNNLDTLVVLAQEKLDDEKDQKGFVCKAR